MSRSLSFAEILERKMATNKGDLATDNGSGAPPASGSTPISTTPNTTEVSPEAFSFDWSRLVKTKLQSAYPAAAPASATRVAAPPYVAAPPLLRLRPETEWAINDLSTVARLALEKLYIESNPLTRSLVKRAYRRLAKRLHPDVATASAASCEAFLLVQAAYDVVMRELDQLEKRSAATDKQSNKSEKKAA